MGTSWLWRLLCYKSIIEGVFTLGAVGKMP
jgi:hypothetical protein